MDWYSIPGMPPNKWEDDNVGINSAMDGVKGRNLEKLKEKKLKYNHFYCFHGYLQLFVSTHISYVIDNVSTVI
jgi:hypothetical protein